MRPVFGQSDCDHTDTHSVRSVTFRLPALIRKADMLSDIFTAMHFFFAAKHSVSDVIGSMLPQCETFVSESFVPESGSLGP